MLKVLVVVKKDDPHAQNVNFDKKILHQAYSPVENYTLLIVYNCIYSCILLKKIRIFYF